MNSFVRICLVTALLFGVASSFANGLEPLRVVTISEGGILSAPLINEQGLTAFVLKPSYQPRRIVDESRPLVAALTLNSTSQRGVYAEAQLDMPELVAGFGQQVPGAEDGVAYDSFTNLRYNNNGDVAFTATLVGTGTQYNNNEALLGRQQGESLRLILREGQHLPIPESAGEVGTLSSLGGLFPALQQSGRVHTAVRMYDQQYSPRLLHESPTGELELVDITVPVATTTRRQSRDDPSVPTTLDVIATEIQNVQGNAAGAAVFETRLLAPPDHDTYFSVAKGIVKSMATDQNRVIALLGDTAPERPETFGDFLPPAINNQGDVAFVAALSSGTATRGIFRTTDDALSAVALTGLAAPDTEDATIFNGFGPNIWHNDRGETVFHAYLLGPSTANSNNSGIYIDRPGLGPSLVVREGDPAPGTEEGTYFRSPDFGNSTVNNAGQVAFWAELYGTSNRNNDAGIWAQDRQGDLHLIAREGDELDVSGPGEPADLRTILSLDFHELAGSGPAYGTGFNDCGQLAFAAAFTDGSYGVFVSNAVAVPEPMSMMTVMGGLLMLVAYRAKCHYCG